MWYELTHRVNYHTVETHIVWARTKHDILPIMDHLKITACTMHKYND